jgi:DNA-binding response OmpR family regulator
MRLLLVEDEVKLAAAIKKGLEQERFAVDVAHDGLAGADLALTEPYDVIVLDVMLPEKDGFAVCSELRQNGITAPILMLTAKDQLDAKLTGLSQGADDYLTKPFAFAELVARLRALLRRPPTLLGNVLQYDDLQLDSAQLTVKRGAQPIRLSHKEFSLLEFLLRHQNQIVSKEKLIAHVWDYDADILPNTVEVTIRNLRKKIDEAFPGSLPLLQTARGYGYRLGKA